MEIRQDLEDEARAAIRSWIESSLLGEPLDWLQSFKNLLNAVDNRGGDLTRRQLAMINLALIETGLRVAIENGRRLVFFKDYGLLRLVPESPPSDHKTL